MRHCKSHWPDRLRITSTSRHFPATQATQAAEAVASCTCCGRVERRSVGSERSGRSQRSQRSAPRWEKRHASILLLHINTCQQMRHRHPTSPVDTLARHYPAKRRDSFGDSVSIHAPQKSLALSRYSWQGHSRYSWQGHGPCRSRPRRALFPPPAALVDCDIDRGARRG